MSTQCINCELAHHDSRLHSAQIAIYRVAFAIARWEGRSVVVCLFQLAIFWQRCDIRPGWSHGWQSMECALVWHTKWPRTGPVGDANETMFSPRLWPVWLLPEQRWSRLAALYGTLPWHTGNTLALSNRKVGTETHCVLCCCSTRANSRVCELHWVAFALR